MSSEYTVRHITLPDGISAIEIEYHHHGGSETQLSYDYKLSHESTELISKQPYTTDYWGKVTGLKKTAISPE